LATEKEISSTSKLLELIRQGDKAKPGSPVPGSAQKSARLSSFISPLFKNLKSLSPRKNEILGVDFTGRFLNLVRVTPSPDGPKVINARSIPVPRGLTHENPEFPPFLKRCLDGFTRGNSKISIWSQISSSKAEIWSLKVPAVKKNFDDAVFWTAKKDKPFSEKEYQFDFTVIDEITDSGPKKNLVCAYIVPHSEIKLQKRIFARAGYQLEGITVSTFAFRNFFRQHFIESGEGPYAVLYIAHDFSRIDIHENKNILLSRVIKTGMDSMAESLMYETGGEEPVIEIQPGEDKMEQEEDYDLDQGYELLLSMIKDNTASLDDKRFAMISPALGRLVRQVERTFDHLVNVQGHKPVEKIFLAGFPLALTGLSDFFSSQLGVPVESIAPLNSSSPMHPSSLVLGRAERAGLALATALALSDNAHTPNFLYTSKNRKEQRIASRMNLAAAFCSLLLVLSALGYTWHASREMHGLAQEKARLENTLKEFDPLLSTKMISELSLEFQEKEQELRSLSARYAVVAVMGEVSYLIPDNISILNLRLDMDSGPGQEPGTRGAITVDGIVTGPPQGHETALSGFLLSLRRSILFVETDILRTSSENFPAEGEVLRFTVNIRLGRA
jgi:Tfp pilus assembly PilM family ATPase